MADIDALFSLMEEVGQGIFRELHPCVIEALPGATVQQMGVALMLLQRGGRISVTDLANELGVTLSAVTAGANRMIRAGLLRRYRDSRDRRVVWLELTPAGRDAVEKFREVRNGVLRRVFSALSGKDVVDLFRIMEKLRNSLVKEE